MIARAVSLLALLSCVACSSSKSSEPPPWPERPLVPTAANIGGIDVRVSIPEGVGRYDDPNGIIWRDVSTDFAFFIKVFAGDHPASLEDAVATVALDEGGTVIEKAAVAGGFRVVVKEVSNGRHTVRVWRAAGERGVLCHAILGRKLGDAERVAAANAWVRTICDSLELAAP